MLRKHRWGKHVLMEENDDVGPHYIIGPLRRAFLTWISEFPMGCLSMCVRHVWPKLVLNPESSKKKINDCLSGPNGSGPSTKMHHDCTQKSM
jgi:hypothetical protein